MRFLLFLLFIYSLTIPSLGQKPPLIFHNLTIHDGLSENSINSIIEDKRGYMWFGTQDGLNKYDGYKFTIYKSNLEDSFSISNRNIKWLFIDSKSNLWIPTTNGINIYDPTLDLFYNFKNNKHLALKYLYHDVVGILEDPKGRIWISTSNDGLYCITSLNKQPQKFSSPFDDESKFFSGLMKDTDSTIWVGSRDGLLKFNINTGQFYDQRSIYGQGYEVRKFFKDENGNVWVCTSNGLKRISKDGTMKEYLHDPANPYSVYEDGIVDIIPFNKGNFLVGTNSSGVEFFNERTGKFYHYFDELSSNNINCLFKDSKGDIWVGTYLNGLNFSNSTTNLFYHQKNNFYSDRVIKKGIVTSFLKDSGGNLWISTDGGGLFLKKKGTDTYINFTAGSKGLTSNVLISLLEDPDGDIWVTSYGAGLFKYHPPTDSFTNYKSNRDDPNTLFNDFTKDLCYYDDKLWISGYDLGVGIFDKKTGTFTNVRYDKNKPDGLPSNWIQTFYVDKEGTLWLGTFDGLSKYNAATNSYKNYLFQTTKPNIDADINTILEIVEDSKGNFWIGTMGDGLLLFNKKDGSYKIFTSENGLSDNFVKSIIEDNQNNLWIGTNDGITKFNIITKKAKPYTIKDGVPLCSYHFNARFKDELGRIYLGANNGIVVINPRMTHENRHIPPVVLTEFKIFNQIVSPRNPNSPLKFDISTTKEIVLPYNQNSLTFEFAALNFNSPKNNQFAYYLEGFDNTWFYVGTQRTATYTNLNPGTYMFKVKASNNDYIWNEGGISVKIVILPPFWKTWWFISIIIGSLLVLLYLIYEWRTRMIRKENMLLDEMVKQRTSQLKAANDQLETFVYKASHDIKGPLKSIIGLTAIGKKDILAGGDPIPYLDHILKSTSKLDTLIFDLLTITKIKQTDVNPELINFRELISEVLVSFQNFPGYERMKFEIDIKENHEFLSDKKFLTSIIQNLIENSIKYSDDKISVSYLKINISVSAKGAYMVFQDNGIGIPDEFHKKIFDMFFRAHENASGSGLGLYIVRTAIEKLNGTISLDSKVGKGTTFYVKL